jgi:hypothetical protein
MDLTETPEILMCQNCNFEYNVPIVLPCGNTICMKCIEENNYEIVYCRWCAQKHVLSRDSLLPNKLLVQLISAASKIPSPKQKKNVFFKNLPNVDEPKKTVSTPPMSRQFIRHPSIYVASEAAVAALIDTVDPKSLEHFLEEKNADLDTHLVKVRRKVHLVRTAAEEGRKRIDEDTSEVANRIEAAAQALIDKIEKQKFNMLEDLMAIKKELLTDYQESDDFKKFKNDCVVEFSKIEARAESLDRKSMESYRDIVELVEKLERMNAEIYDKYKVYQI